MCRLTYLKIYIHIYFFLATKPDLDKSLQIHFFHAQNYGYQRHTISIPFVPANWKYIYGMWNLYYRYSVLFYCTVRYVMIGIPEYQYDWYTDGNPFGAIQLQLLANHFRVRCHPIQMKTIFLLYTFPFFMDIYMSVENVILTYF